LRPEEDADHGGTQIVIANRLRNPLQPGESLQVGVKEGFQTAVTVSPDEGDAAAPQLQTEERDDQRILLVEDGGFSPVGLSHLPPVGSEGDEDLPGLLPQDSHCPSDGGLSAPEAIFLHQTVINAVSGVSLLAGSLPVFFQPALDEGEDRI
jgi:hypothetical protein